MLPAQAPIMSTRTWRRAVRAARRPNHRKVQQPMKLKKLKLILPALIMAALCAAETFSAPLGAAFTYQGRLHDGGAPANGNYDFAFLLYDAATNGLVLGNAVYLPAVPVTNGLFTVLLNANNEFGPSALNGSARWLDISMRTNTETLGNNFVSLTP